MQFNTIFQLYALSKEAPEQLKAAKAILLVPDYFNFLLSGKKINESTELSTTQLVNARKKIIDKKLLKLLDIDKSIFPGIANPSTIIGKLKTHLSQSPSLNGCDVVLPPAHDTAAATSASLCSGKDTVFISSGTWSILGAKLDKPICSTKAMENGYTNEGSADGKTLFMTNIMGMWLIQECMKLFPEKISYHDLDIEVSKTCKNFALIDVTDSRFLNPKNMIEEIKSYCAETNQNVPNSSGEIARVIFESLAECYAKAIKNFEKITHRKIKKINIVGGGCRNNFLNQETANRTKCTVKAGPVEATAIGNILAQLKSYNAIKSEKEEQEIIKNSFNIIEFKPN